MKHAFYLFLGFAALFSAQTTFAADAEAGKVKAAVCASCHGVSGVATIPIYPNLAGQNEPYLVSALKGYRDKQRNGGMAAIMQMQAATLSDDDIDNLAAYFTSLK
jgi:cytochrome c553